MTSPRKSGSKPRVRRSSAALYAGPSSSLTTTAWLSSFEISISVAASVSYRLVGHRPRSENSYETTARRRAMRRSLLRVVSSLACSSRGTASSLWLEAAKEMRSAKSWHSSLMIAACSTRQYSDMLALAGQLTCAVRW
jgi:hypothetical protein